MTFPHFDYSKRVQILQNPNAVISQNKGTPHSIQSNSTPIVQSIHSKEISPHDQFWQILKDIGLIDDEHEVISEAVKGMELGCLNEIESQKWLNFLCQPINAKLEIKLSLIELYAFLFTVTPKVGIRITSTSLFGGAVPHLFGSYYIRTCHELYEHRCKNQKIIPQRQLISNTQVEDLQCEPPDYDLITGMEGDLSLANSLFTKFFSWKLANVNHFKAYDLKYAVDAAINFAHKLVINYPNNQFFIDTFYPKEEEIIGQIQAFYNDFYDSKKPAFSLASFGVDRKIDHNFVSSKNVGNPYFLHHALRVPYFIQAIELINIIHSNTIPISAQTILKRLTKITPLHEYKGGYQTILDRIGKEIHIISEVNDRALGGYISLISKGYINRDPGLPEKLFNKIKDDGHLTLLKKALKNHHSNNPLDFIAFAFNALNCLPPSLDYSQKCQSWWQVMMSWYDEEIKVSQKISTSKVQEKQSEKAQEKQSDFFMSLKNVLDKEEISFQLCRDMLQMYGCLTFSSSKNVQESPLNVHIRNLEKPQPQIVISQTVESKNRTISFHLNLHEALESILQLNDTQVDILGDLIKHLSPKGAYNKKIIPTKIFNKKLADRAVDCFEKPHLAIKKLGYNLLLLFSLSNPEPEIWVLKNLIKYLPLIIEDPLSIANLKMVLEIYPDNEEIHKLISPLKDYCQNYKNDFKNGCYELCLALANLEQSSTAVNLFYRIKVNANEQLKFLKAILFKEPLEAIKLFCTMQNQNCFSDKEEIENFAVMAKSIQKNCGEISYVSLLKSSVNCVKGLFRKERTGPMLRPAYEPLIAIVVSLCQYGFSSDALDLLVICSKQCITLMNENVDNEIWLTVCEAGIKHPDINIEDLHNHWLGRCSSKCTDQELVAKIKMLESKFHKCLYEKYRDTLLALQNSLKDSAHENHDRLNQDIENCNANILKLLGTPELLECSFDFFKQMANCPLKQQQTYIDLALNLTLECANSINDPEKLIELDGVVKNYLDAIKNTDKEYSVRQISLIIAKKLLLQKRPDEAMKWMHRIFRIAVKNNPTKIVESNLFDVKGKSIPLLSFNLPANPVKLLDTIVKMPERELDVYKKLTEQRPCSNEISNYLAENQRAYLAKKAKEFMTHTHQIVQRLGFELTMACAVTTDQSNLAIVDMNLLNELMIYLPMILVSCDLALRLKLVDRMKSILKLTSYSTYTDDYIDLIPTDVNDLKLIYLAHFKALASSKSDDFNQVGKTLISKRNIEKLTHLSLKDSFEIALSFVQCLIPTKPLLALESMGMIENGLKQNVGLKEQKEVFVSLIESLIELPNIDAAKKQLISCVEREVFQKHELKTTELWIRLLKTAGQNKLYTTDEIAKLWNNLLDDATISKKHFPEIQICLLMDLIPDLFDLKKEISSAYAIKLINKLHDYGLNTNQKYELSVIVENKLRASLDKDEYIKGYQNLKSKLGDLLSENSKLNVRKSYLEVSLKYENYDLALEILAILKSNMDDESIIEAFNTLCAIFFKESEDGFEDIRKLEYCFRMLRDINVKCIEGRKLQPALMWLAAADKKLLTSYINEKAFLLKIVLKAIESEALSEDTLLQFINHLLKYLQIAGGNQAIPNDLKSLTISCHPKFTKLLQVPAHIKMLMEYLKSLCQNHFSVHINSILSSQVIWVVSEFLKKDDLDPSKLKEIHDFLNSWFKSAAVTNVDNNILEELISALLLHNLPQEAAIWIKVAITSSDKTLSLPYAKWNDALFEQNVPQLCLILLDSLKDQKNQPSFLPEQYLKVSKKLLENDFQGSAQILLSNWNLINENCFSKVELNEHLKNVISQVFTAVHKWDVLTLYTSFMSLYKIQDDFLLDQLKKCCTWIDAPPKNLELQNSKARVLQTIDAVFFPSENYLPIGRSPNLEDSRLISILTKNSHKDLIQLGIKKLNFLLRPFISDSHIDDPVFWHGLIQTAIENWFLALKAGKMTLLEIEELELLIKAYSKSISMIPVLNKPDSQKNHLLFLLQLSLHQGSGEVELAIRRFNSMIQVYYSDLLWLEKSLDLALDSIFKISTKLNDYQLFLSLYRVIGNGFDSVQGLNARIFLKPLIRKCLDNTCPEGILRSILYFQAGVGLEMFLSHYEVSNALVKIFNDDGSINIVHEKEITEIVQLVEEFVYSQPVINQEYVITNDPVENRVREVVTNLYGDPQPTTSYKEIFIYEEHKKHFIHHGLGENGQTQTTLMRDFPLTNVFFKSLFRALVSILEGLNYDKAFPELARCLQFLTDDELRIVLTVDDGAEVNVDDVKVNIDEVKEKIVESAAKFEETSLGVIFNSFSTVLNRLIGHKSYLSSVKALEIIKMAPQCLWTYYSAELSELLMLALSDKKLYSDQTSQIFSMLIKLNAMDKTNSDWVHLTIQISLYTLDQLLDSICQESVLKPKEVRKLFTRFMVSFTRLLHADFFREDDPQFVEYLKNLFKVFPFFLSPNAFESGAIINFVKWCLAKNPKSGIEICEIFNQNYEKFFLFEPEHFEHNNNLTVALFHRKYFEIYPTQHETCLTKLIQNFKYRLDVDSSQTTHYYSQPLIEIFGQILMLKNPLIKDALMRKMYSIVQSNIRIFLPNAESSLTLESNIEVLHLLKHVQYYDDSVKKMELYQCEVEKISKQFQIFCIMNVGTERLHKLIEKVLRSSEIAIIISNAKQIQKESVKVENIEQYIKDNLQPK